MAVVESKVRFDWYNRHGVVCTYSHCGNVALSPVEFIEVLVFRIVGRERHSMIEVCSRSVVGRGKSKAVHHTIDTGCVVDYGRTIILALQITVVIGRQIDFASYR